MQNRAPQARLPLRAACPSLRMRPAGRIVQLTERVQIIVFPLALRLDANVIWMR
jgi:hypothetical protein